MAQVELTFSPRQFVDFYRRLGQGFMPAALRGARSGALRCLPVLQEATRGAAPASARGSVGAVNTGYFLRAWKTRHEAFGALIFNAAPYSGVLEGGRRKGGRFPPRQAVARWAQRKLGLSDREAQAAAFPIARAIARRGLRARRILRNAIPDLRKVIVEEIEHELARALRGQT